MNFRSTKEVAKLLNIEAKKLSAALWVEKIQQPQRAPSGAFLWTKNDIERASWVLRRKSSDDVLPRQRTILAGL